MSLTSVQFQLVGPGQRANTALVRQAAVPALTAWLEARLGPVARVWAAEAAADAAGVDPRPEAVSTPPVPPSPPAAEKPALPPITARVDVVLAGAVAVTLPPPREARLNATLDDVRVRACGTVAPLPEPPPPPIKASLVATLDDARVSACGTVTTPLDPLPPLPAGPGSTAAWARLACRPCSHPTVRALACDAPLAPMPPPGASGDVWRAYIFGPDRPPPPPKPRVLGAVAPLDEWPLHWCPDCEREGHEKPDLQSINVRGMTLWRCTRHDTHGVFEPPRIGDPGHPVRKASQ